MYINTDTLAVYKSQNDIRLAFPNTCFPVNIDNNLLASINILPILEVAPVYNSIIEKATEISPTLIDGVWTQQWLIENKYNTPEELTVALQEALDIAKENKIEDINTAWLDANNSTFTHNNFQFDCNALAQQNIATTNSELANNGGLPPYWIGGWKTFDNQWYPITTYEEWKAFYSSMFMSGIQNFSKAQTLKTSVYAIIDPTMESINTVEAISW